MTDAGHTSKERLLSAVVEYVADHGVADLSLRRLAAAIGTSHRMLIYHFGSKEELFIEVIRAVEEQQRRTLVGFELDPRLSPSEVMRRMWGHLSDPALWPNERLFFETYGQALQARPHTAGFLEDIVESWLEPATALRVQQGVPAEAARAQARLDLAMTRGLLLDVLTTGDVAGVDQAVEQFITLFEAWQATSAPGRTPTASSAAMGTRANAAAGHFELDPAHPVHVLLISGSLRVGSTNTSVLRTAAALAPAGMRATLYDGLAGLPHFNPDDDVHPLEPAVAALRGEIRAADGVLFSTPEYAGALPGSFKNLLDWTIGDDEPRSIYDKPVGWINASPRGAAEAHDALRHVLGYANAIIVDAACTLAPVTSTMIGPDGLISDPSVRDHIARTLTELGRAAGARREAP